MQLTGGGQVYLAANYERGRRRLPSHSRYSVNVSWTLYTLLMFLIKRTQDEGVRLVCGFVVLLIWCLFSSFLGAVQFSIFQAVMPVWCFQGEFPDLDIEEVISGLMFQGKCIITWWFSWALFSFALTSDGFCRRSGAWDDLSHAEPLQLAILRRAREEGRDSAKHHGIYQVAQPEKYTFQETLNNINYSRLGGTCQDVSGA